jgi:hypothetical protein
MMETNTTAKFTAAKCGLSGEYEERLDPPGRVI